MQRVKHGWVSLSVHLTDSKLCHLLKFKWRHLFVLRICIYSLDLEIGSQEPLLLTLLSKALKVKLFVETTALKVIVILRNLLAHIIVNVTVRIRLAQGLFLLECIF